MITFFFPISALTKKGLFSRGEEKEKIRNGLHLSIMITNVGIVILGFFYLILLNKVSTQGFVLAEIKEDRVKIQKELEKWNIENAIPISIYALESSEQIQQMQKVETKQYVMIKQNGVALAK